MDKSAIEQIQTSAHIPALIEKLSSMETHVPSVIVPNGFSIESLESKMENRSSYRLEFKTESIKDFIAYGKDFSQDGTACFVDSSKMHARTIFDLGTLSAPLHQQHKAIISLKETAAFCAVLNVDGSKMSQKTASDFIEDWADNIIVFSKDGSNMNPKAAAASLRNLTIETARELNSKVDDYSESMSAMERVEAKNQELLPSEIHFKCVPYLHLEERTFVLRVSLLTSAEKPCLIFRATKLETIKEEIAEEFKDILVDGFDESGIDVYLGTA